MRRIGFIGLIVGVGFGVLLLAHAPKATALGSSDPTQSGSVGLQGTITSAPPTSAATIGTPANGAHFTTLPITVSGLCSGSLLIKVFANNVFVGSAVCQNGSYTMQIDLFDGTNDLIARVYDSLDQQGPDSNTIAVTYTSSQFANTGIQPLELTSNYARRGANPGSVLTWPIVLSGGTPPYALSVSWGDNKATDLLSESFAGTVTLSHTYDTAGLYQVIIKATDKNGQEAFLQLVGVANGAVQSSASGSTNGGSTVITKTNLLWGPAVAMIPLIIIGFWLGRRAELTSLRRNLER
ncbi:MAG TPA: hypothetical protein VIM53_00705 [Candidatus Saccharimonadales bacterium]